MVDGAVWSLCATLQCLFEMLGVSCNMINRLLQVTGSKGDGASVGPNRTHREWLH
jgi:hypothetical protein